MSHATSHEGKLLPTNTTNKSRFSLHVKETSEGPSVSVHADLVGRLVHAIFDIRENEPPHVETLSILGTKMLPPINGAIFRDFDLWSRACTDN
jgi:flagellar biosynthesis/type III secretory pathway ATPase